MRRYQHLFFDLDHTIWDFETNSRATLAHLFVSMGLRELGIPDVTTFLEVYHPINHRMWGEFERGEITRIELRIGRFLQTLAHFGKPDIDLANAIAENYLNDLPLQTNLFDGAAEVLHILKERDYQLHLITNGFTKVQIDKLERAGIRDYFTHIITSELAQTNKPHPEIFHLALQTANATLAESIMIGDNPHADMLGAKKVGMDRILFNTNQHPVEVDVTHESSCLRELIDWFRA